MLQLHCNRAVHINEQTSFLLIMSHFGTDPLGRGMIRLIHMLPRNCEANYTSNTNGLSGQPKQPQIKCTIEEVSLEEPWNYSALSYTWGEMRCSRQIIINGAAVPVTESVETALRHLQQETEVLSLWVDQLCINQDNNVERSEQVRHMKTIYSKAAQVLVWLGPAADDSDNVMDLLEKLGKEAHEFGVLQLSISDMMGLSDPNTDGLHFPIKKSIHELVQRLGLTFPINSYRSLVEREWWRRVWVLQELSVAQDVVFVCGERRLSYQHFIAADSFFRFYVWTIVTSLDPKSDLRVKPFLLAPVNSAASSMLITRRKYQGEIDGNRDDYTLYRLLYKSYVRGSSENILKATNPRDKLFGLLGLAKDAESLDICVNYDNSCSKVYKDAARKFIQNGHVDILSPCQYPKNLNDLPSWVPDWSAPIRTPCGDCSLLWNLEESFSASAKFPASVDDKHTLGDLEVIGIEGGAC